MNKVLAVILAIVIFVCGFPVIAFVVSNDVAPDLAINSGSTADEPVEIERVADDALFSDNGYVDYAKDVYFDTDIYPDLEDQGLFWNYYDPNQAELVEVPADSEEGAKLVDPSKPTIVMVHGMIDDGNVRRDMMMMSEKVSNWEEFGIDGNDDYFVAMLGLWLKKGYNVATFHYHKFTTGFVPLPADVETKLWSTDGDKGVSYCTREGKMVSNVSEYCVAEHFVAEYLRAMSYLPETFGDEEIRVAAHSMGGEISAAALFLMTEMASDSVGQLDRNQLPDRYAMLDTYFSTNVILGDKWFYTGPEDINIRWSGKQLVNNNMGETIVEALKQIEASGIVLEYYSNQESFLLVALPDYLKEQVRSISVTTIVKPDWSSYDDSYTITTDGHEGDKYWYLCSIWFDEPIVVDADGNATGETAPSASMSTEDIKALKGKGFVICGGEQTIKADDDEFVIGFLEDIAK